MRQGSVEYTKRPRLAYPVVMGRPVPLECPHLDTSNNPKDITNQCSSVLGDGFHAMHRPKVPMDHHSKKAYVVAFQEAFMLGIQQSLRS